MRDVADGGDDLVVFRRAGLVQDGAEPRPEGPHGPQGGFGLVAARGQEAHPAFEEFRGRVARAGLLAPGHRVGADERIGGRQEAGGFEDRAFHAAGVGHDGARRQARADRPESFFDRVDGRRHDHQVGPPHARGGVIEDFGDAESAQGGPRSLRARPTGQRSRQPPTSRGQEDGPADESGADDGDALELSHFQG